MASAGSPPQGGAATSSNGVVLPPYVVTVQAVYEEAHGLLERSPEWGQEPPHRGSHRFLATPVADCVPLSPEQLTFAPSPDSPAKPTALKNLGLGLGLILLGLLLMVFPHYPTVVLVYATGLFLLASGLVSAIVSLLNWRQEHALTHFFIAVGHAVVGAWMLYNERTGAKLLIVIVAVWIVAKGFARKIVLVSCVIAVLMVVIVHRWRDFPAFLLGYDLVVSGVVITVAGVSGLRSSGGPRETDPLVSQPQATAPAQSA